MNDKMTHPLITLALASIPIKLQERYEVTSFSLFEHKFTLDYYFMILCVGAGN
jgi:hypothetical protein